MLMVIPAQRNEIIIIKPPAEIDCERRYVMYRQFGRTDLPAGIAHTAAVIISFKCCGRLPAPSLRIPEFVRLRITYAGVCPRACAPPLMYLVAY